MLPHHYPFRWIDIRTTDRARLRLSLGGLLRDAPALPEIWTLEILAQGAMVVLARQAEGTQEAVLAAIDEARLPSPSEPLRPGDTLEVEVRRSRGFGSLLRLEAILWRGDLEVASAQLTVARGGPQVGDTMAKPRL